MEKPTRKESCILLAVAALVFIAWFSRLWNIPLSSGPNVLRSVIYPTVFIFWAYTLRHRLIHDQVRHLVVSIAVLMVIWFAIRTIRYSIPVEMVVIRRYLWYLYYLPMLFIPTLAVFTALTIGLPEGQRLPERYNVLWILAAAVFLLVITNDLHQLVFVFPDNNIMEWSDQDYRYGVGYYVYVVYMVSCNLATLVIMIRKNRCSRGRRWVLLPCLPVFLLLCYLADYAITGAGGWIRQFCADMTAVSCVLYMLTFELCIRCGLIRSNTGYEELFRNGQMGASIADHGNHVRLSDADSIPLTEEQITAAAVHPLLSPEGMLLKSTPIPFGHVLWQEDIRELRETIDEFEENCRDLAERNRIRRENLETEKNLLAVKEKNRAADLLQRETAGQLGLIDRLLSRYESEQEENNRRRFLAGAALVGAYIKRYGNLLLVCERNETARSADLIRCFEESFLNLELLDVECLCSLPADICLQTRDMLRIYHTFEDVLEDCMFELRHVWVNGRERDGQILINMEFVSDVDLACHASEDVSFSDEDGSARFTFRVQKGGAEL